MKLRAETAVRLLQRPGGPEIRLKLLHLLLLMLDLGNCARETLIISVVLAAQLPAKLGYGKIFNCKSDTTPGHEHVNSAETCHLDWTRFVGS